MLKTIKQTVFRGLKSFGFFHLALKSEWRASRLLILCYHGVSLEDEHQWNPELFITPDLFAGRLRLLRKWGCTVLPLDEAICRLYANDLPEHSVAITFDDGFYNFLPQAHPILKEFGFPATVYVTTFYSQYNRPVFDEACSYLLWKGRNESLDLNGLIGQESARLPLSKEAARAAAFNALVNHTRRQRLRAEEKDELLARVAHQLKLDYEAFAAKRLFNLLTPGEIERLGVDGVDIQLHTHHHHSPLDRELFRQEIEENRKRLRRPSASHFCYPSGIFDEAFFPWLKELGMASATTCEPGLATRESNPMMLPRLIDTCVKAPIEFEAWLTGVATVMPKRQHSYNPGASTVEMRSAVSVHR
jgi:peptidoglycan/xylan/chitin deacetylase (PgdA/CDA1 family)